MVFRILSHVESHQLRSHVETHPRLRETARVLVERHGMTHEGAVRFLERLLTRVVDGVGESYLGEMGGRIDRVVQLRDRLSHIYEGASRGEFARPEEVRRMFNDLQREMDAIQSPSQRLRDPHPLDLPPLDSGVHISPVVRETALMHVFGNHFARLREIDPQMRDLLISAAERYPDRVRRLLISETSEGLVRSSRELRDALHGSGMGEDQIGRMIRELELLNEAQRQAAHTAGITDARLREATSIGRLRDSRLRDAATGSDRLRRWAVEAPETLENMWEMYNRKSRNYPFDTYVGYLERHIRGNFGEFEAAFRLGNDFVVLKAPDGHVTIRGTDLVVVDRRTGELLLIDNKALSAEELHAVSALTRNLPHNVLSDLREFKTFSSRSDTPIEVAAAVQRFEQATQTIQTYTSGMSRTQLNSEPVQQHIAGILQAHSVRRVITNAGGQVRGLSPALQGIGVELRDLN